MYGKYQRKPQEWKDELHNHLLRSEIRWIADNGGAVFGGLEPYCGDAEGMKNYLRSIGFKIKRKPHFIADFEWIDTSDRIAISVEDGICVRVARRR